MRRWGAEWLLSSLSVGGPGPLRYLGWRTLPDVSS